MGRRARNKFVEDETVEENEDYDNDETVEQSVEDLEYEYFGNLFDLYNTIHNYREKNNIPVCEFLTMEKLSEFLDSLN